MRSARLLLIDILEDHLVVCHLAEMACSRTSEQPDNCCGPGRPDFRWWPVHRGMDFYRTLVDGHHILICLYSYDKEILNRIILINSSRRCEYKNIIPLKIEQGRAT